MRRADIVTERRSIWRYATALPVQPEKAVTMGEGWTPLVSAEWDGTPVHYKLEYMMPTGSFKDRGTSVLVSYLKEHGIDRVMEDSSGNAGASMSAYAARAGMVCRILVPAAASPDKIVQIASCGADIRLVPGTRQAVADEAMRQSAELFYASHNWQPLFLEGIKTLAYELWEQGDFEAPDNIVMPLGYGSNVLGCYRGFEELLRNGEVARMPRLFGVQAAACAPIYEAFVNGHADAVAIEVRPTLAEGVASSRPTRGREVLRSVRESGGAIVAAGEDELLDAWQALAMRGFFVEPTCAVAAAGLSQLLTSGQIGAGERTVLVLTGTGLKASSKIREALHARAARQVAR
jgi:threonine synthase